VELWERYKLERENVKTLYFKDLAFVAYSEENDGYFIQDIYVLPEHRASKISHKLADIVSEIAKSKNKKVYCQSDESSNGWDVAHGNILKYGFEEYDKKGSIHHYIKRS